MRTDSQPTPRALFRIFATAEMVTWALLIIALILRGTGVTNIVPIAGGIHGFVFLSYCVVTVFTWVNQKWKAPVGIAGLLLSVIPFATVPFELYLDRRGLLTGGWRLAPGPGSETPNGFIEKVQAWVLAKPVLAAVLLLAFVTALFIVLLLAGPPIPKS
ncbi:DUF3817 domain-containing protein [Corynebacterium kozikiae]|uniref:DUF3817 domain-containing protein n=1 Tax=Corynebacterium kozikiae TaxID=2968469 RepID=UPI00211C3ADF|nr:DUF3817 domain-containing protein [Corynebacterium sp. 76QC2CO]